MTPEQTMEPLAEAEHMANKYWREREYLTEVLDAICQQSFDATFTLQMAEL